MVLRMVLFLFPDTAETGRNEEPCVRRKKGSGGCRRYSGSGFVIALPGRIVVTAERREMDTSKDVRLSPDFRQGIGDGSGSIPVSRHTLPCRERRKRIRGERRQRDGQKQDDKQSLSRKPQDNLAEKGLKERCPGHGATTWMDGTPGEI